ncbi:hypothetical protein [Geotalea sp. SG265]|uniref:hypothetical protein n=1 Tax=Geotalea sp. SG265 TaxID=2922867 RepID=UPI001FAF87EE|nr:hypothetical protein [Geotalea sp. SG265]
MKQHQKDSVLALCAKSIEPAEFFERYGITPDEVGDEVKRILSNALESRDAEEVEYALMLGFCFSFPDKILPLIHDLLGADWHESHENMISILQDRKHPSSVEFIRRAALLKPELQYLEYDDYGAYYKKCMWALQAIGTEEAIEAIKSFASAEDPILAREARYRLENFKQSSS